jgi:hypothetical protein
LEKYRKHAEIMAYLRRQFTERFCDWKNIESMQKNWWTAGITWSASRRIIDLFASWWTAAITRSAAVGRWYLLDFVVRESNYGSFEDRKRTLEELKSFFLQYCLFLDNCICISLGA